MKVVEKVKKGKVPYLHATALGHQIIQLLPDSISSPEMTAEWEAKLSEIESGKIKPEMFMKNIQFICSENVVSDYGSVDKDNQIASQKKKYPEKEVIGKCPTCGAPVYENSKSFYCSDYKNCKFSLWKENNYFKAIGFTISLILSMVKTSFDIEPAPFCTTRSIGHSFPIPGTENFLFLVYIENDRTEHTIFRCGKGDRIIGTGSRFFRQCGVDVF